MEKKRIDREAMRLVQFKAHFRRQVYVDNLRNNASSLSRHDVAARIKKVTSVTGDASRLVDEFKPREFTELFSANQAPKMLIAFRKYTLPRKIEDIYRQAVREAKNDKVSGPDGVPMKRLKICPEAFAEPLCKPSLLELG